MHYKLSELDLELIEVCFSILGIDAFEVELTRIMDSHKGPYDYSGRPTYLVSLSDLSQAPWSIIYHVLQIGMFSKKSADNAGEIAQEIEPEVMEELLEGLEEFLRKRASDTAAPPAKPRSRWKRALELNM